MRSYEMRAMSVGEILDGAVSLYRTSFTTLVSIAIVCMGVPTVIRIYAALSGDTFGFISIIALLLWSLGGLVSSAATLLVISETYLGRTASVGDALRFAFGKIGPLFVAGLAMGILIMLATLLLIVPGIIVACGYAVVSQVVVLENASADTALKRSWQLTKGFKGKAFGLGCVVFLILMLPAFALGFVAALLPGGAGTATAAADFISLLVTPLVAATFTLFYYDLRVRKEAFDLEMLSQQLSGSPAVVA